MHPALAAASVQGLALVRGKNSVPPAPGVTATVGFAHEWLNLITAEHPKSAVNTIQNARAPTKSLYEEDGSVWAVLSRMRPHSFLLLCNTVILITVHAYLYDTEKS